jgi:hypothetical protein
MRIPTVMPVKASDRTRGRRCRPELRGEEERTDWKKRGR